MLVVNESCLLSCYVLTKDSQRRLREVLSSIQGVVDDIVVVDSGSTDGTLDIVKEFGVRLAVREFDNFREQREYALSLCRHDWVLELDSDEVVSTALAGRLAALKLNGFAPDGRTPDAFGIRREWFVLGRKVHCFYPSRCPDRPVRLYRRSVFGYRSARGVHEALSGRGWVLPIAEPILHYTCDSIDQMYAKINQYSTLAALEMHREGRTSSWLGILVYPWVVWFKFYVLYGGWRDGGLGVVHGRYVRDSVWQKLVKLKYDRVLASRQ